MSKYSPFASVQIALGVRKVSKYLKVFELSAIHTLRNYKALIGHSFFLVTCLVIFAHIWKIAAAKTGVVVLNPDQLLWYIAFNEWILMAVPEVQEGMESDLRSGKLAYLLPRPISYLHFTFFEGLGALCVNLVVLGSVSFLFTWLNVGGMALPVFLMMWPLGLLAGCVGLLFRMLIGLSAFWLHYAGPLGWMWDKLLFALGGLMLPLAVYPLWLQKVARFTPFPSILGDRSALAVDYSVSHALSVMSALLFWGMIGWVAVTVTYRRGLRIVNVEGG